MCVCVCVCVSAGTANDPNPCSDPNHSCSDPFEPETEERGSLLNGQLQSIPEDEQVDASGGNSNAGSIPSKRSKFIKTHSIMLGVDRIDEYSQMDIHTP